MDYEHDPLFMLLNIDADGSDDEPNHDPDEYSEGFQNSPFDFKDHLADFISEDGDYYDV